MRKDFPPDAPPALLLASLEERVLADAALSAEWAEAWGAWPEAGADARVRERFREWFLLEREAVALGAPPAAVWAPRELGERDQDPWTRLLEAQFRVLRVDEPEDPSSGALTDLWSGQSFEDVVLPVEAVGAQLLLGRLAPWGVRGGQLLPGWRSILDLALADALAGDLARVRAEQPRARLSQRECEWLLAPHWARAEAARAAQPANDAAYLRRLEEYLRGAPQWDVARALAVLEHGGTAELLDRIAFESKLPLEPLRQLIAEWNADQGAQAPALDAPRDAGSVRPESIRSALAAYDRARAHGVSLNQAWSDLQEALELEDVEPPDEAALLRDTGDAEAIGPASLPGLGFWIETWTWEREREGRPVSAAERAAASAFARFAEGLHEGELDAAELHASDLWSFYAGAASGEILSQRISALADLVQWLRQEQGAFVLDDPADWTEADRARLQASVTLNARLRALARPLTVTTRIAEEDPPQVLTDQGDAVVIAGAPEESAAPMRRGDLVAGVWTAGAFHLAAWFPQPAAAAKSNAEA